MSKRTRNRMIVILGCILCIVGILACLTILFRLKTQPKQIETVVVEGSKKETTTSKKKKKTSSSNSTLEDRVSAYMEENPELSEQQALLEVKMNLDYEPYTNIQEVEDPDAIDLLVNKYYQLPSDYIPSDLVSVTSSGENGNVQMREEAASAFEELVKAAKSEGIELSACSAFRSYSYQEDLFENGKAQGGLEYADQWWTRPGHSEHQTGLSVDIRLDGDTSDLDAPRYSDNYPWLLEHMHEYGFILRYPDDKKDYTLIEPESWHLRYVGVDAATEVYEQELCWEEYVAMNK